MSSKTETTSLLKVKSLGSVTLSKTLSVPLLMFGFPGNGTQSAPKCTREIGVRAYS